MFKIGVSKSSYARIIFSKGRQRRRIVMPAFLDKDSTQFTQPALLLKSSIIPKKSSTIDKYLVFEDTFGKANTSINTAIGAIRTANIIFGMKALTRNNNIYAKVRYVFALIANSKFNVLSS
jgi:hypothetical protein